MLVQVTRKDTIMRKRREEEEEERAAKDYAVLMTMTKRDDADSGTSRVPITTINNNKKRKVARGSALRQLSPRAFKVATIIYVLGFFHQGLLSMVGNNAPSVIVSAQENNNENNEPCSVCDDLVVGSPNNQVQDPVFGDRISCSELQNRGDQGSYNTLQCQIIGYSAAGPCNCIATSTTKNPPCDVCFGDDDLEIGLLDEVVQDPIVGDRVTCSEINDRALNGSYNQLECLLVQSTAAFPCRCQKPASTTTEAPAVDQPPSSPTTSVPEVPETTSIPVVTSPPVQEMTDPPVEDDPSTTTPITPTTAPGSEAPISTKDPATTAAPSDESDISTMAPTQKLSVVTGRVLLELESVAGPMPDSTAEAFENQTTAFLQDELRGTIPPVHVAMTELINQEFAQSARRRLLRALQSNLDFRPLSTTIRVTGGQQPPDSASFSNLIAKTINDNPDLYIAYLRNSTPPINQVYFKSVENVTADTYFNPESTTLAPDEQSGGDDETDTTGGGGDDKLSSGAKAGIAVGAIAGFCLLVAGGYYLYKCLFASKSEETGSIRDQAAEATGHPTKKMRQVVAPAGKLGLILKATPEGTVIHEVKSTSPLVKTLMSGDVIVKIDNVKAKNMSVKEISQYIAKTQSRSRNITVLSDRESSGASAAAAAAVAGEAAAKKASNDNEAGSSIRKVIVPPGKLGIVIDTTAAGPAIQTVRPTSPLLGKVVPGDLIVLIDDVETKGMSASDVNALMVERAGKEKVFTVRSSSKSKPEPIPSPPDGKAGEATAAAATAATAAAIVAKDSDKGVDNESLRKVDAPAGRLGIIIDTTPNGPVVSEVKPDSPLKNSLFPGDIVVTVDDEETKGMSVADVNALMAKKAGKDKVFMVRSTGQSQVAANTAAVATTAAAHTVKETPREEGKVVRGDSLRKVNVPAGRLGIVIDTTPNGAVVNEIRSDSPLKNVLVPGDKIVLIDGEETKGMSVADVNALMVKKAKMKKVFMVHSAGESQEGANTAAVATTAAAVAVVADNAVKEAPKDDGKVAGEDSLRKVNVPAGRLGIVIDTTPNGAVVNEIRSDSPLKNVLVPGDKIVLIDGKETKGMSVVDVNALMVKKAKMKKVFMVHSAGESQEGANTAAVATTAAAVAVVAANADKVAGEDSLRKVNVPAGRLGIVIDTTPNGAVVNEIRSDSPLKNVLVPGDKIVLIDGEETKGMSVTDVNDLMVKKAKMKKVFMVSSPTESGPEPTASPTDGRVGAKTSAAAAVVAAKTTKEAPEVTSEEIDGSLRRVEAPPGRLGIIIDTTENGPIVSEIKADSPLKKSLNAGDVIVKINNDDAMTMSAASITAFMVKTKDQTRIFTVRSKDSTGKENTDISKKEEKVTDESVHKVEVFPGRLGIIIDTTANGPVVHEIKADSPLRNDLVAGDLILKIDGVDATKMSASSITSFMVDRKDKIRTLTVKRKDNAVVKLGEDGNDADNKSPMTAAAAAAAAASASSSGGSKGVDGSTKEGAYVHEVCAPPGKLFIVVDTSTEGPVVNQILPTSPLKGVMNTGDIIVSINGQDTRDMEGSDITDMMIKTANESRILKVLSKKV